MSEVRKENYQNLAHIILRTMDYLKLKEVPYNSKGNVDKHNWKKQVKEMTGIWEELVLGKDPKLTKIKPKNLIDLESRLIAYYEGDKTQKIWRSTQDQSPQN